MAWDGAGTFNRARNFSADASAGIRILASAMDQEFDNYKTGLESIVDGTEKLTLNNGSVSANPVTVGQWRNQVPIFMAHAANSNGLAYSASAGPAWTPQAGSRIQLAVATANATTIPTLNVNGAGAAPITSRSGTAIATSEMLVGYHNLTYDGTNWRLDWPLIATSAEVLAATNNSGYVTPAGLNNNYVALYLVNNNILNNNGIASNSAYCTANLASMSAEWNTGGFTYASATGRITLPGKGKYRAEWQLTLNTSAAWRTGDMTVHTELDGRNSADTGYAQYPNNINGPSWSRGGQPLGAGVYAGGVSIINNLSAGATYHVTVLVLSTAAPDTAHCTMSFDWIHIQRLSL